MIIVACHREPGSAGDPQRVEHMKRLEAHAAVEALRLLPFSPEEVGEFVARRSGRRVSPAVVSELRLASGGNPLLLGELLRASIARSGGDWSEAPIASGGPGEVIDAWLGGLSEGARHSLRVAAVLGQEFDAAAVIRVRPDEAAFESALREGLDARILIQLQDAPDRYRFAHAVLRETLYDELGDDERSELHRAVGVSLEAAGRSGTSAYALAHHFFTAFSRGDAEKAIDYGMRAGDDAAAVYASDRAASHYRKTLHVLELQRERDPRRLCEVLTRLGTALSGMGDRDGARTACRRAAEIARAEGWSEAFAIAVAGFASDYLYLDAPDPETVSLLEEALEVLGPEATALRCRLLPRLSAELCMHPDRSLRQDVRQRTLEAAQASPAADSLAQAVASSAYTGIIENCVSLEDRLPLLERAVEQSEGSEDRAVALQARLLLAEEQLARGACDRHDEIVAATRAEAMALGDPLSIILVGFREITRLMMRGRFREVERRVNDFFVYGQQRIDPRATGQIWLLSQVVQAAERGRMGGILAALESSDTGGDGSITLVAAHAWVYCEAGRTTKARKALDTIMSGLLPPEPDFPIWEAQCATIAHVCRELGAREYAPRIKALLDPLRGRLITRRHVACHGPASLYLGLLAELSGRLDEAEELLEEAAKTAEAVEAPPWLARIRFAQARLLVESKRGGDAGVGALLDEAIERSRALGMARILEQSERLRGGRTAIEVER
jgi:tetratricopeptide (TPR) repeat protein